MQKRFVNPSLLAGISGLDPVAKSVGAGFVTALRRKWGIV